MSFRSTLKLDAKIFNQAARRRALRSVAAASAKAFKKDLREKMIRGEHSGKVYRKKRGTGFTRAHRASAPGERPAPDSFKLANSIKDQVTSEYSAKTEITAEYGAILQEKMGREVMTAEDVAAAEKDFLERAKKALASLL